MYTIMKLLKGCALSCVLFAFLLPVAAAIFSFTSLPSSSSPIIAIVILALCCGSMGYFAANAFGKRGLLTGMAAAFLLEMLLITVVMAFFSMKPTDYDLGLRHLLPVLLGGIGGVMGISYKK